MSYPEDLNDLAYRHHEWLKSVGWTGKHTPLEELALIASEVGEAANECRGEEPTDRLGEELADIILRTLGMAHGRGINIQQEVWSKMAKNRERGTRGRLK